MSIQLNHTIVWSRDKHASARFPANILGLPVGDEFGPFVPIRLGNAVTLDYMTVDQPQPQHYAFLVDDDDFDAAFARIQDQRPHLLRRTRQRPTRPHQPPLRRVAYGAGRGGAALVRPDGFLAWRTPKPPPETHATLCNVLTHLLAQPTPRHQRQGMSNAPPLNTKNGTDGGHDLSAEHPLH